jgi:hypothetical protein
MLNGDASADLYGSICNVVSASIPGYLNEGYHTENKLMKYKPKNATTASNQLLSKSGNGLFKLVPSRPPVPPSVLPGVAYDGFAAGPRRTAASIAEVRARESAPLIVLITDPDRNIRNVGMLFLCQHHPKYPCMAS